MSCEYWGVLLSMFSKGFRHGQQSNGFERASSNPKSMRVTANFYKKNSKRKDFGKVWHRELAWPGSIYGAERKSLASR